MLFPRVAAGFLTTTLWLALAARHHEQPGVLHDAGSTAQQCQKENQRCTTAAGSGLLRGKQANLNCCHGLVCMVEEEEESENGAVEMGKNRRAAGGSYCVLPSQFEAEQAVAEEEEEEKVLAPKEEELVVTEEEPVVAEPPKKTPPKRHKATPPKNVTPPQQQQQPSGGDAFYRLYHYGDTSVYEKSGYSVPEIQEGIDPYDAIDPSLFYYRTKEKKPKVSAGGQELLDDGSVLGQAGEFRRMRALRRRLNGGTTDDVVSNTIKINCGGGAFDARGYSVDFSAFGYGHSIYTDETIQIHNNGDVPRTLYQSLRQGKAFTYSIPASARKTLIKLHFCDIQAAFDQRRFRVDIEGVRILDDFNPSYEAARRKNLSDPTPDPEDGFAHAVVWEGYVDLADGTLDISFTGGAENAIISGIEIHPLDPWMLNMGSLSVYDKLVDNYYVEADSTVAAIKTESVLNDFTNLDNYPADLYRKMIYPNVGNLVVTVPIEAPRVLVRFHVSRSQGEVYNIDIAGVQESFVSQGTDTVAYRYDFGRVVTHKNVTITLNNKINAIELIPSTSYLIDCGCVDTTKCNVAKDTFWPERWMPEIIPTAATTVTERTVIGEVQGTGLISQDIYTTYREGADFEYAFETVATLVELKFHVLQERPPNEEDVLQMTVLVEDGADNGNITVDLYEHTEIFEDYDYKAYVFSEKFFVTDAELNVRFIGLNGNARVSAIEVYPDFVQEPEERCINQENVTLPCGTETPVQCQRTLTELLIQYDPKRTGRNRNRMLEGAVEMHDPVTNRRRLGFTTQKVIWVVFHAIYKKSGVGMLSSTVRDGFIKGLRRHFEGIDSSGSTFSNGQRKTPFKFKYWKTRECKSSTCFSWHHFSNLNLQAMRSNRHVGNRTTLNVYLGNPNALGVYGQSFLPENLLASTEDQDGVLIWNPDTLPNNMTERSANKWKKFFYETLAHEAGHWLGLYHTFHHEQCSSNAWSGDGVVDTASQDCPTTDYKNEPGFDTCYQQKSHYRDSCPSVSGKDARNNIMDYIDEDCSRNYGQFTTDQITRMTQMWDIFRDQDYSNRRRDLSSVTPLDDADRNDLLEGNAVQSCLYSMATECDCNTDCFGDVWGLLNAAEFNDDFKNILQGVRDVCHKCSDEDLYSLGATGCEPDEVCVPREANDGIHGVQIANWCAKPFGLYQVVLDCGMCASGYCSEFTETAGTVKRCMNGPGDECNADEECHGSLTCVNDLCDVAAATANDNECTKSYQCQSQWCDTTKMLCSACTQHSDCDENRYCDSATSSCLMKKDLAEACTEADQCWSKRCEKLYAEASEKKCIQCQVRNDCPSGTCLSGGICGDCERQTDCPSGFYCDLRTFQSLGAREVLGITTPEQYKTCRRFKLIDAGVSCTEDFECGSDGDPVGCSPDSKVCTSRCVDGTDCNDGDAGDVKYPVCLNGYCVAENIASP